MAGGPGRGGWGGGGGWGGFPGGGGGVGGGGGGGGGGGELWGCSWVLWGHGNIGSAAGVTLMAVLAGPWGQQWLTQPQQFLRVSDAACTQPWLCDSKQRV